MLKKHTWLELSATHKSLHRRELPHNCTYFTREENRLFFEDSSNGGDFPYLLKRCQENIQN